MKRLIFGSGKTSTIIKNIDDVVIPHSQCDITNIDDVVSHINQNRPDVVINCAAKTNLEYCEENKKITYQTNTGGVINILHACADIKAKFIHISSGCLFDGNKHVSYENSTPNTSVWYTHTKKWADEYISSFGYENYCFCV